MKLYFDYGVLPSAAVQSSKDYGRSGGLCFYLTMSDFGNFWW